MGKEIKSPEVETIEKRPGEDIGPEESKKLNNKKNEK